MAASVRINQRSIEIYHNGFLEVPPKGKKLNKPALVILNRVTPTGKRSAEEYGAYLKQTIEKVGAMHVSYDMLSYRWVFKVNGA